jgi:hypothetical protein
VGPRSSSRHDHAIQAFIAYIVHDQVLAAFRAKERERLGDDDAVDRFREINKFIAIYFTLDINTSLARKKADF